MSWAAALVHLSAKYIVIAGWEIWVTKIADCNVDVSLFALSTGTFGCDCLQKTECIQPSVAPRLMMQEIMQSGRILTPYDIFHCSCQIV
jgi:hypothetical protein